jgi:DNA polymerase I-like protein with 3'-5' exonuclease and polymerase domains
MNNKSLEIAVEHLRLSKEELSHCSTDISSRIEKLIENAPELSEELISILSALQLQDIITQRLDKIEDFLRLLDGKVDFSASKEYLEEFAWENEVDQDDIDAMFN